MVDRSTANHQTQEFELTFADITVVPVAESRKDDYLTFSRRMAEVYRGHGAIRNAA